MLKEKRPAGEKAEEAVEVNSFTAVPDMFGSLDVCSSAACDGQQGRILPPIRPERSGGKERGCANISFFQKTGGRCNEC